MLYMADQALYKAKDKGRNQVYMMNCGNNLVPVADCIDNQQELV
jgi:hypothetical protein